MEERSRACVSRSEESGKPLVSVAAAGGWSGAVRGCRSAERGRGQFLSILQGGRHERIGHPPVAINSSC